MRTPICSLLLLSPQGALGRPARRPADRGRRRPDLLSRRLMPRYSRPARQRQVMGRVVVVDGQQADDPEPADTRD